MKIGDRVKLTERVARTTNNGFSPNHRVNIVDWTQRRGVVVTGTTTMMQVRWDDRKTLDQWPVKALEKV